MACTYTKDKKPWEILDSYRPKYIKGEWPTIVELFTLTAHRFPDNPCFISLFPEKENYSYTESFRIITQISNYLVKELGVKKGDRVAVTGKNSPQWAFAYFGILFAGAIVVPLDYALQSADMEKLLKFTDVKYLFADHEKIDEIGNYEGFKKRFCLEKGYEHPYVLDCLEEENVAREIPTEWDTAAILFTSGTTGTPKGVMLSHRNITSDAIICNQFMPLYDSDVFYAILPLHHAYTMVAVMFSTIWSGASCVFGKRLIVSRMLKELKEGKVTMMLGVPMLFNKMLSGLMTGVKKKGKGAYILVRTGMSVCGFVKRVFRVNLGKKVFRPLLAKLSLDTNRICICGAGPLPPETFKQFNQLGIDFVSGYGLTETSPITHLNPPWHYKEASVGCRFIQEQVKIVDPDSDGNGLIYIKGPQVMQGYYHNQEATDEVLDSDGWLNTGDIGHQDSEGYLYLTGRKRSIIVTEGGKNVFPEEIEDKFQLYNEIDNLCVIGYKDDRQAPGELVRIIIHPLDAWRKSYEGDVQMRMEEIVEEVNKSLQPYKKITRVTVTDTPLPITSSKKVQRFKVKELYENQ